MSPSRWQPMTTLSFPGWKNLFHPLKSNPHFPCKRCFFFSKIWLMFFFLKFKRTRKTSCKRNPSGQKPPKLLPFLLPGKKTHHEHEPGGGDHTLNAKCPGEVWTCFCAARKAGNLKKRSAMCQILIFWPFLVNIEVRLTNKNKTTYPWLGCLDLGFSSFAMLLWSSLRSHSEGSFWHFLSLKDFSCFEWKPCFCK